MRSSVLRRGRAGWAVVLGLLMVLAAGGAAGAVGNGSSEAWPLVGGDFRVSGPRATEDESSPAVAYNAAAGEWLVVWSDWRNSETRGVDIYGRRVDGNGSRIGREFRISGPATARSPAVAYNAVTDEYLVVWEDYRHFETRDTDIYGRRVDGDGSPIGRDFRISGPHATRHAGGPAVAINAAAGEFLVIWGDTRKHASWGFDIYGRRVGGDGSRIGGDFPITGPRASGRLFCHAVAYGAAADQYLMAWADGRHGWTGSSDVYGRLVGGDGSRIGREFRISRPKATDEQSLRSPVYNVTCPAVTYNAAADEYLVVWSDWRNETTRGTDIYGRRVDGNGSRIGKDFRISGRRATNSESAPSLAYSATAREYLVVWIDDRSRERWSSDTYGQRVGEDGSRIGWDFRVSDPAATNSSERSPAVAHNGTAQEYLVVWRDYRNDRTRGTDIFGRRVAG